MTATLPYESLGIPPQTAEAVEELTPLGVGRVIAQYLYEKPEEADITTIAKTVRDLTFPVPSEEASREPSVVERACLVRFCGNLADRLGMQVVVGESNGK